jgi:plasmid maintenance system antidote protein VapI
MGNERAFERFIEDLIKRYGTAGALADAIGMSLSAFSRGYREEGTLSVENCLRLANEVGERPEMILRLAGKQEVADVFERLSGVKDSQAKLSGKELEIATRYRMATQDVKDAVNLILPKLGEPPSGMSGPRRPNNRQANGRQKPNHRKVALPCEDVSIGTRPMAR